jgi:hypothetical protein
MDGYVVTMDAQTFVGYLFLSAIAGVVITVIAVFLVCRVPIKSED